MWWFRIYESPPFSAFHSLWMSVSLCQVARVGHFQQDFATKTFTKLISAQKVISRKSLVGIITTKIMAQMGVETFTLDLFLVLLSKHMQQVRLDQCIYQLWHGLAYCPIS